MIFLLTEYSTPPKGGPNIKPRPVNVSMAPWQWRPNRIIICFTLLYNVTLLTLINPSGKKSMVEGLGIKEQEKPAP